MSRYWILCFPLRELSVINGSFARFKCFLSGLHGKIFTAGNLGGNTEKSISSHFGTAEMGLFYFKEKKE